MSAAALILPQALDSLSIKGLNVPLALVIYTQLAIINVAFVELLGIVAPGGQAQAQAMPPTQAAVARNAGERRNLQVRGRAGQRPRSAAPPAGQRRKRLQVGIAQAEIGVKLRA